MEIQCECGKFRAQLTQFPRGTPGRLRCYCRDCQIFMSHLNRTDLLDENGGTEIIPAYPADINFISGKELIQCVRLYPTGMFRFSTACCNTPIANTEPNRPWVGIHSRMYTVKDPNVLDVELGPVKCSIMGKDAKGELPPGVPQKFDLRGMLTVMPYILKGILLGKSKPSPFFVNNEPIVKPKVLTNEERLALTSAPG